ncbi:MAG: PepSY-like domain-containing protein [Myxococcota bacterium]|nr:PepSY-like domain-containing protein [Myxococcota bacterium]
MKWLTTFTVLPALLISSSLAFAGDDLTFDELPKPVQTTVQREVGAGKITEIEREVKRGQTLYEIEFYEGDKKWEIHVDPDGKLLARRPD